MTLNEVLHMKGFETMIYPGTMVTFQVVQPQTRQGWDPSQTVLNTKPKVEADLEEPDTADYNHRKPDELKNYFDDDKKSKEVEDKITKSMSSLKRTKGLRKKDNFTTFTHAIRGGEVI